MLLPFSAFFFAEVVCVAAAAHCGRGGCCCCCSRCCGGGGEPERTCTRSSENGCGMAVGITMPRVFVMSVRGAGHVVVPSSFSFPLAFPLCHLCAGFLQSADDVARQARTAPPQTPNTKHQTPNTEPQTPNPKHQAPCMKPCSFPLSILCRTVFCTWLCCWGPR